MFFVDDCVFRFRATSACELTHKIQVASAVVEHAFASKGLTVKYKRGKTQAIASFIGYEAKRVRHDVFITHLGCFVSSNNTDTREVNQRIIHSRVAVSSLSKNVLRRKEVYIFIKVSVVRSLIHSILLHNVHTLNDLSSASYHKLAQVYHDSLRSAMNISKRSDERFSNEQVCVFCKVPHMFNVVIANKVALFMRVLFFGSCELKLMLSISANIKGTWCHQVISCLNRVGGASMLLLAE